MKHIDVTILNGDKHMKRASHGFRPRPNPDGGELMREIGKTLLTTAIGAAVAVAGGETKTVGSIDGILRTLGSKAASASYAGEMKAASKAAVVRPWVGIHPIGSIGALK